MKDKHDDGHGFGFKAVYQPGSHRFVRSAEPIAEADPDAEAGLGFGGLYGGPGYGGFGHG